MTLNNKQVKNENINSNYQFILGHDAYYEDFHNFKKASIGITANLVSVNPKNVNPFLLMPTTEIKYKAEYVS